MKARPRAFAFAAVFLLVADLVLRAGLLPVFPADFRIPARTLMGYDAFVQRMADSDHVRVAVIGDSVVAGQFADSHDTLPAHLDSLMAGEGRTADAYNLGLPGAQAVDLYAVAADVAANRAADIVIINLDYRFYGRGVPAPRYPELWDRLDANRVPAGLEPSVAPVPAPRSLGARADEAITGVWRLYAERDALAAAAFGEIPRRRVAEAALRLRLRLTGSARYAKKADADLPLDELRKAYDVPRFAAGDASLSYLGAAIDACRDSGASVYVFAGPLDRALLDRNGIVDWARYDANIAWARQYVSAHGATFIDMTDALPASMLGDSHHPLGAGYARMARMLGHDIAADLDRLGAPAGVAP